ncbi:MAG: DJ-1/PfpI family protein [Endomicrobia bacterium]|nr:DJ-1/PfpI family protein [Endomicrobiia bacterium]MCL2145317.1 DJ-1/PfpI family protein [Endomicrobiia bacterium]
MKKVVFITAPEIFRDEEYAKPKEILESAGVKVVTASTKKGEISGRFGMKTVSDMTVDEVNPDDFDAIVYVGGSGASVFFENPAALNLAKTFFASGKPTTAICIAPTILANAGVLEGKTATVFPDGKEALVKGGANYTGNPLEIDGNIITANAAEVSDEFGNAVLKAVNS